MIQQVSLSGLYSWIVFACHVFQHYASIMKYISQPPLLLDVHIHKPLLPARTWMDSLLAFFPGLQVSNQKSSLVFIQSWKPKRNSSSAFCSLQVLKGDIRPCHRDTWNALSGYQETQLPPWGRSSFFSVCLFNFFNVCGLQTLLDFGPPPHVLSHQAFTTDFRVHWAQHPLRPEFAESTYFLYKVQRCHWVIN